MAVEVREDGLVALTVEVEGAQGVVPYTSVMTKDAALAIADEIAAAFKASEEVDALEEDVPSAPTSPTPAPVPPAPAAAAPAAAPAAAEGSS